MSENRFTPGPWAIIHPKGELNDSFWIGPTSDHSIAEVRNGAEDEEYGGAETELANTHLIAAAPDLFAALEWIADIADKAYEQDEKLRSQGARTLMRISDKASSALSKARGDGNG